MSSPIYIKIHNQLRENIEDGKWKVGEKIPAERELAGQFNVSRMTLRQAIQELVDEGILERRVWNICCQPKSSRTDVWSNKFYGPDEVLREGSLQYHYFVSFNDSFSS